MNPEAYLQPRYIKKFIKQALAEDIGDGDHSSIASVPKNAISKAQLIIKGEGVMAGIELASMIFDYLDSSLKFSPLIIDGEQMSKGDIGFIVEGKAQSILTGERLALNCMQRMSGIATKTKEMNQLLKGTKTKLLDTRKTTPNFRIAEKWAVKIGGGQNHRFGLFDMVMLKDNHIDFAGGIPQAIQATQKYILETGKDLKIEIETRNLEEVEAVVQEGGVDIIMLDNMMPSDMKEAVSLIRGRYLTEASGGINEKTIKEAADCGVDFISVGALTHTYDSIDMSLKAVTN